MNAPFARAATRRKLRQIGFWETYGAFVPEATLRQAVAPCWPDIELHHDQACELIQALPNVPEWFTSLSDRDRETIAGVGILILFRPDVIAPLFGHAKEGEK